MSNRCGFCGTFSRGRKFAKTMINGNGDTVGMCRTCLAIEQKEEENEDDDIVVAVAAPKKKGKKSKTKPVEKDAPPPVKKRKADDDDDDTGTAKKQKSPRCVKCNSTWNKVDRSDGVCNWCHNGMDNKIGKPVSEDDAHALLNAAISRSNGVSEDDIKKETEEFQSKLAKMRPKASEDERKVVEKKKPITDDDDGSGDVMWKCADCGDDLIPEDDLCGYYDKTKEHGGQCIHHCPHIDCTLHQSDDDDDDPAECGCQLEGKCPGGDIDCYCAKKFGMKLVSILKTPCAFCGVDKDGKRAAAATTTEKGEQQQHSPWCKCFISDNCTSDGNCCCVIHNIDPLTKSESLPCDFCDVDKEGRRTMYSLATKGDDIVAAATTTTEKVKQHPYWCSCFPTGKCSYEDGQCYCLLRANIGGIKGKRLPCEFCNVDIFGKRVPMKCRHGKNTSSVMSIEGHDILKCDECGERVSTYTKEQLARLWRDNGDCDHMCTKKHEDPECDICGTPLHLTGGHSLVGCKVAHPECDHIDYLNKLTESKAVEEDEDKSVRRCTKCRCKLGILDADICHRCGCKKHECYSFPLVSNLPRGRCIKCKKLVTEVMCTGNTPEGALKSVKDRYAAHPLALDWFDKVVETSIGEKVIKLMSTSLLKDTTAFLDALDEGVSNDSDLIHVDNVSDYVAETMDGHLCEVDAIDCRACSGVFAI